jgi:hypothetical protein
VVGDCSCPAAVESPTHFSRPCRCSPVVADASPGNSCQCHGVWNHRWGPFTRRAKRRGGGAYRRRAAARGQWLSGWLSPPGAGCPPKDRSRSCKDHPTPRQSCWMRKLPAKTWRTQRSCLDTAPSPRTNLVAHAFSQLQALSQIRSTTADCRGSYLVATPLQLGHPPFWRSSGRQ